MTRSLYAAGVALLAMASFQTALIGHGGLMPSQAESGSVKSAAPLDSRTVPHPDWVQVSGQIQETRTAKQADQPERLIALLQPVEGGRITVDLGPADRLTALTLDNRDSIHVRGTAVQAGDTRMIVAGEIIADGKVIPIERSSAQRPAAMPENDSTASPVAPSPAAPSPRSQH